MSNNDQNTLEHFHQSKYESDTSAPIKSTVTAPESMVVTILTDALAFDVHLHLRETMNINNNIMCQAEVSKIKYFIII